MVLESCLVLVLEALCRQTALWLLVGYSSVTQRTCVTYLQDNVRNYVGKITGVGNIYAIFKY